MLDRVLIPESDLAAYGDTSTWGGKARALMLQQKATWELLRKGYESLKSIETRVFEFDGFAVKIQFNPGRLTSTSAKVDDKSIRERKCFLCPQNLPPAQRGLLYADEYLFLCNPFPIFPEHFTIPDKNHTPQQIRGTFETLLCLSRDLGSHFNVTYNGPKCGASAPDHLHFQAGNTLFMPVDHEYPAMVEHLSETLFEHERLRVYGIDRYLRNCIAVESGNMPVLVRAFRMLYDVCQMVTGSAEEPMMNILSVFDNQAWRLVIFLRAKHRPSFFYEEGDKKIMLSPAAVDLGGVCTTPLEADFRKITKDQVVQMFTEVSVAPDMFRNVKEQLGHALSAGAVW